MFITKHSMGCQQSLLVTFFVSAVTILPLRPLTGQPEQRATALSLEETLRYAIENNHTLGMARLETEIINRRRWEILGDGLPKISSRLGYQYNAAIQRTILPNFLSPAIYQVLQDENLATPPPGADFGTFPASFGTKNSSVFGVDVQQMLFDMRYFLSLKASRETTDYAKRLYREAETDLIAHVKKTYHSILYAQRKSTWLQKNCDRLTALLRRQVLLHANGFSEEVAVDELRVRLTDAHLSLKGVENEIKNLHRLLNIQMGRNTEQPVVLAGSLEEEDFTALIQQTQGGGASSHAAVQKLGTLEALSKIDYTKQRLSYVPTLSFSASLGYNSGSDQVKDLFREALWYEYANFGLNLRVPILSGFKKVQVVRQRKLEWLQAIKRRRRAEAQVAMEQAEHRERLIMLVEMVKQRKENRRLTQSVYDLTEKKHQQGLSARLDVLEANTLLVNAEAEYYRVLYEALITRVDVEKSHGLLAAPMPTQ